MKQVAGRARRYIVECRTLNSIQVYSGLFFPDIISELFCNTGVVLCNSIFSPSGRPQVAQEVKVCCAKYTGSLLFFFAVTWKGSNYCHIEFSSQLRFHLQTCSVSARWMFTVRENQSAPLDAQRARVSHGMVSWFLKVLSRYDLLTYVLFMAKFPLSLSSLQVILSNVADSEGCNVKLYKE